MNMDSRSFFFRPIRMAYFSEKANLKNERERESIFIFIFRKLATPNKSRKIIILREHFTLR